MTAEQRHLYTIKPTRLAMLTEGTTERESAVLSAHFSYLERLGAEGVVFLAGRTQTTGPETFGIVIINTADEAAARAIMENDPAVKGGVMQARLFPYRIAVLGA